MSLKLSKPFLKNLISWTYAPGQIPSPVIQKYIGFTVNNLPLKFDAPCSRVVIYVMIILHFKPTSSLRLHPV